ncbi:MAG TPA: hypothetical protein VK729_07135, partial [Silvibacterium sp.]|nr:hypothetical protein [Silvibacterium sp.]
MIHTITVASLSLILKGLRHTAWLKTKGPAAKRPGLFCLYFHYRSSNETVGQVSVALGPRNKLIDLGEVLDERCGN